MFQWIYITRTIVVNQERCAYPVERETDTVRSTIEIFDVRHRPLRFLFCWLQYEGLFHKEELHSQEVVGILPTFFQSTRC